MNRVAKLVYFEIFFHFTAFQFQAQIKGLRSERVMAVQIILRNLDLNSFFTCKWKQLQCPLGTNRRSGSKEQPINNPRNWVSEKR